MILSLSHYTDYTVCCFVSHQVVGVSWYSFSAGMNRTEVQLATHPHMSDASVAGEVITKNNKHVWLRVWKIFMTFHILGIIIPTDFHMFQRG